MLYDPRKLAADVLLEAAIKVGKIHGDKYSRLYLEDENNWPYLNNETIREANQKLLERGKTLIITFSLDQNWPEISSLLYGDPRDN